jgi:hypothetical protein
VGSFVLNNDLRHPVVLAKEIATLGWAAELCERLLERRKRRGFANIVVPGEAMESFAPVVARLAGT